jgi:hemolysin D
MTEATIHNVPGRGRSPVATRRAATEFLPAALEILETPPSPAGRAIGGVIILFCVIALVWATFGHVDIIATAQGKVIPSGKTKIIQPFETGVVRAIRVADGSVVKAGDVLVELDSTINASERDRLAKELTAARLDVARLRAAIAGVDNPATVLVPPPGASATQVELHGSLLANQLGEFRAKIANVGKQIAQNESNVRGAQASVDKLKLAIPLLRERVDARKILADQGLSSKLTFLETKQQLVEYEQELRVQAAHLDQSRDAIAALEEQRHQTEAEFRRTNLGDLAQAEQKAASLAEQLTAAAQRSELQTLTAPVDGTVQQLAVNTVNGVVTPAQQLMAIVPADSRLEVEAMLPNKDIGFVKSGQGAEIKIDTFNFTRYGLIHGTVISVSQDAIARDKPQDKSGPSQSSGALANSSEPQGQELVYGARISLDQTQMQIDDRVVSLSPGMAVTVEIKTGERRIIEYVLSPLIRYKQESLRER